MEIFQVDAFADRPFAGNPAAVCPLYAEARAEWMQALAAEMNLSETAFPLQKGQGWELRWFTPEAEVDLCGHATLAAAHVIWELKLAPVGDPLRFETRSGQLWAEKQGSWIRLDFPALVAEPADPPAGLMNALRVEAVQVRRSRFDYLIEVESESVLRDIRPDFGALGETECRGVIVTSSTEETDFDFVSRFFAPRVGVNEDPVTGSAHCVLAPYWQEKTGKSRMIGFQASRRGGIVRVECTGDRVYLEGRAVTVFRGELTDAALP